MNIRIIYFYSVFCASFALNSYEPFHIELSKSNKKVILSEILTNFLIKYFSDKDIFVTIILEPLHEEQQCFQQDLFVDLFDNPALTEFAYSILDQLDSAIRDHRNAFNLIIIENNNGLTCVFFLFFFFFKEISSIYRI